MIPANGQLGREATNSNPSITAVTVHASEDATEDRDEPVSLYPHDAEDVLRALLNTARGRDREV